VFIPDRQVCWDCKYAEVTPSQALECIICHDLP
jgi:hypothetical protein